MNAIYDKNYKWKTRSNKGIFISSKRALRKTKKLVRKQPLLSSKAIFDKAGLSHIKKDTRCRALRKIVLIRKASKRPPLAQRNMIKRLAWARKYLK